MRTNLFLLFLVLTAFSAKAQYRFTGHVDNTQWHNNVYLSIIEDYRKISGVYTEQIIAKTNTGSLGYFKFTGNQLENENRIYRIHVDNCFDDSLNRNHFDGHCDDSKEVIFIAKNTDSIEFPFTFDKQMFCDINSSNEKSTVFVKVDSIREEMKFAFSEYRSEANRKLNNKKWFKTLQDFGEKLDEPIAELYIYSFLSDRTNDLHEHYLEDLKSNSYYDNLLLRLTKQYPNSPYTKQYKAELTSDEFIINQNTSSSFNWNYVVYPLLVLSLIGNFWFWLSRKKHQTKTIKEAKEQLTKQEQNILNLLLEEKSNKEIADALFVSLSTVKTHVNNIYKKMNVQSRDDIKSLFNS
ncbi:regulatory LuxR family protein [Mariniflexile fucanivorans]|uniref:Regulatory LuxR family protein n=1 Tax=Mariniflexile fucanivorans TaxID=264023 RepID=A0A4R1RRL2_9FLAO|nr:LuxR C-terminal-related transcriptional regulator [Mariniflexile fucanivorans]TCL68592.1 regulatory LuxR family protein [Mariniflexile fucanivorans]